MAKVKDGGQVIQNALAGDAAVSVDKIITAGENKVRTYHTTCTQAEYEGGIEFEATDLIAYLTEIGDIGASKESKEVTMFHLQNTAKITTGSTLKDLSLTEALTTDGADALKKAYKDNTGIAVVMIDTNSKKQLYSCWGTISEWGMSISNGDTCTVNFTLALSDADVECVTPETKTK